MGGYRVRCPNPCPDRRFDPCWISSGQEPFGMTNLDQEYRDWHDDWQREVDEFLASCAECPEHGEYEAED